jgi:hypothetical protein
MGPSANHKTNRLNLYLKSTLRGEYLDVDLDEDHALTCSRTKMVDLYAGSIEVLQSDGGSGVLGESAE